MRGLFLEGASGHCGAHGEFGDPGDWLGCPRSFGKLSVGSQLERLN